MMIVTLVQLEIYHQIWVIGPMVMFLSLFADKKISLILHVAISKANHICPHHPFFVLYIVSMKNPQRLYNSIHYYIKAHCQPLSIDNSRTLMCLYQA